MNPGRLIRLSIELENKITASGDLLPLPGKEATLFVISQYEGGSVSYFHEDMPSRMRAQIASLGVNRALHDFEAVKQILTQQASCLEVFPGIGYFFAEIPLPSAFPEVVWQQGCYVILVGGHPVSWAWSSGSSAEAVELAVETDAAHRRKGYARQVVSAWAHHHMKAGKVAFYSHRVGNLPSQKLAENLGVVRYARVCTYATRKLNAGQ